MCRAGLTIAAKRYASHSHREVAAYVIQRHWHAAEHALEQSGS